MADVMLFNSKHDVIVQEKYDGEVSIRLFLEFFKCIPYTGEKRLSKWIWREWIG